LYLVPKEIKAPLAHKDFRGCKDPLVLRGLEDQLGQPGLPGLPVWLDLLVLKV
jgi:hypothetical protein